MSRALSPQRYPTIMYSVICVFSRPSQKIGGLFLASINIVFATLAPRYDFLPPARDLLWVFCQFFFIELAGTQSLVIVRPEKL